MNTGTAKLPDLNVLTMDDYQHVYEPSDDTFLLCDALEGDRTEFVQYRPRMILEIGCGSGCVITFLAQLLRDEGIHAHCLAVDLNPVAARTTQKLALHNGVYVDVVQTHLVNGLSRLQHNHVDVLLFNPPYVPTPLEEVGQPGITASWAGGEDGRVVIDEFLPLLDGLLSPSGRCYLILVEENKPKEIMQYVQERGMQAQIIRRRKAVNEALMVVKIWKESSSLLSKVT